MPEWKAYAGSDMPVYIPHFRNVGNLSEKARMAAQLIDNDFRPVVHIAARNVRDEKELDHIVSGMTAVGVQEFLLLGGGEAKPLGEYDSAMQILSSGVLERHGVKRVGFAGHPENHPDQPRNTMRRALTEKNCHC